MKNIHPYIVYSGIEITEEAISENLLASVREKVNDSVYDLIRNNISSQVVLQISRIYNIPMRGRVWF